MKLLKNYKFTKMTVAIKKYYKELKNKLRIPISDKTRSLNVVVAASISAAEALRQIKIF